MSWSWTFENSSGDVVGRSEAFDGRSDAESWIGEAFGELIEQGIDQVRLFDAEVEVYGPMSLHAENN